MFEWLFLTVPWGCLRFVIVVFPDHTHYFSAHIDSLHQNSQLSISNKCIFSLISLLLYNYKIGFFFQMNLTESAFENILPQYHKRKEKTDNMFYPLLKSLKMKLLTFCAKVAIYK